MKVFFSPIVSVQEFDKREAPAVLGKTYSQPLLTDTPDEFEDTDPTQINTYAAILVDLAEEGLFRDDLCRLFLLGFFVNNQTFVRISCVLATHGIRTPVFSDYRFVGAKHIRDKDANDRYRRFVREKYRVRFLGGSSDKR